MHSRGFSKNVLVFRQAVDCPAGKTRSKVRAELTWRQWGLAPDTQCVEWQMCRGRREAKDVKGGSVSEWGWLTFKKWEVKEPSDSESQVFFFLSTSVEKNLEALITRVLERQANTFLDCSRVGHFQSQKILRTGQKRNLVSGPLLMSVGKGHLWDEKGKKIASCWETSKLYRAFSSKSPESQGKVLTLEK